MKFLIFASLSILLLIFAGNQASNAEITYSYPLDGELSGHQYQLLSDTDFLNLFTRFKQRFNLDYHSPVENSRRFQNFKHNLHTIARLNDMTMSLHNTQVSPALRAKFGATKFADLTEREFRESYLNNARPPPRTGMAEMPGSSTPANSAKVIHIDEIAESFDWRDKDAITPVYNQEQCGSCWAFSATETIESYWYICGHDLTQLSMQQIVDCDPKDLGCNGGWTYNAFEYVISAGGILSYDDYPYNGTQEACQYHPSSNPQPTACIKDWVYVTQTLDEDVMRDWVYNKGPISVCLDAATWQFYNGGVIIPPHCSTTMDHCVQVTGYGVQEEDDTSDDEVPVWNVRNSWGAEWGVEGYAYLLRGNNTCGIANLPLAVTCCDELS